MFSVRLHIQSQFDNRRINVRYSSLVLAPIILSYVCVQPSLSIWKSTFSGIASFVLAGWHFALRVAGTSLGIGLGLGLAGHVYDVLSDAASTNESRAPKSSWGSYAASSGPQQVTRDIRPHALDDDNSYHALMRSAGYTVDSSSLRAQMINGPQARDAMAANDAKRELMTIRSSSQPQRSNVQHHRISMYQFDKGGKASSLMRRMWPNLSPLVNDGLAKLTEYVLRDYVSSWYSKIDENLVYNDPTKETTVLAPANSVDTNARVSLRTNSSSSEGENQSVSTGRPRRASPSKSQRRRDQHDPSFRSPYAALPNDSNHQQRTMILTTTGLQQSPFIESLYGCFAYLFGMMATRASENVNVLELLLIKFPSLLSQNLRVYRLMRQSALEKKRRRIVQERERYRKLEREQRGVDGSEISGRSSSFSMPSSGEATEEVSEISIVREYLLAGRLHRAVTFGLDVPSILFADPLAKDCPPGPSFQGNSDVSRIHGNSDEDAVLYDRVLSDESTLIYECELDYGRVLASKITKLVVPKDEIDASVVKTLLAEMLASCVLGPVMGCFAPDSVNGWLIKGLGLLSGAASDSAGVESNESPVSADAASDQHSTNSTSSTKSDEVFLKSADVESEDSDLFDRIVDGVLEEIGSDGSTNSQDPPTSVFGIEHNEQGILNENASCNMSEQIITALSMSIIELGSCVDFDDCRLARDRNQDIFVDWDAPNCRDAVKHLVLIIEAALLYGARSAAKQKTSSRTFTESFIEMESMEVTLDTSQEDIDDFSVDVAEELRDSDRVRSPKLHQHSSLSAALMELTGDIDTFQGLVEDVEGSHDGQSTTDGDGDDDSNNDTEPEIYIPRPNELSTLRTLIAAWLHTGQAFKVLSIIVRAKHTILEPFYHSNAFLRGSYSAEFIKLLRKLDAVDILVDTMAVLASPCLLMSAGGLDSFIEDTIRRPSLPRTNQDDDQFPGFQGRKATHPTVANSNPNLNPLSVVGSVRANFVNNRDRIARFAQSASEIDLNPFKDRNVSQSPGSSIAYNLHQNSQQLPAYLNYNQNEVFASSLRLERDRRSASWLREIKDRNRVDFVSRTKGAKDKDTMMHRELHHLARYFLSNTSHIRIESCSFDNMESSESAANVILKAVCSRRKVEVPDEDSSFLLRAQVSHILTRNMILFVVDRTHPSAVPATSFEALVYTTRTAQPSIGK